MTDTMTRANVDARVANLNERMESRGSIYRYEVQGRNGKTALDRVRITDGATISLVTIGTKREVGDFLHAMMVALDDAAETVPAEPGHIHPSRVTVSDDRYMVTGIDRDIP